MLVYEADASKDGPFAPELTAFIEDILRHFHAPSASIGIVQGDKTYIKVRSRLSI